MEDNTLLRGLKEVSVALSEHLPLLEEQDTGGCCLTQCDCPQDLNSTNVLPECLDDVSHVG